MKPAIHLHIRALSLPSHDAAQRNAFFAAMVHELIRRASENSGAPADASAGRVRVVADNMAPGDASARAAGIRAAQAVASAARNKA
ncbi:hypothetical protein [Achromobacter arsenitoxydans]|nr:hypothetical protein [Achromobacter arsenitoxydans]